MSSDLLDDVRDGIGLSLVPITIDQYLQMIRDGILHDGDPIELIRGTLVYKDRRDKAGEIMTHGARHLKSLNKLTALLARWVDRRTAFLQVQGPICLDNQSVPEPDCSLIAGNVDEIGETVPHATSALAVFEVSDHSLRYDQRTKLRLYSEDSIPVYVIVNLRDELVEVYTNPIPTEPRYENRLEYARGANVEIAVGDIGLLSFSTLELF